MSPQLRLPVPAALLILVALFSPCLATRRTPRLRISTANNFYTDTIPHSLRAGDDGVSAHCPSQPNPTPCPDASHVCCPGRCCSSEFPFCLTPSGSSNAFCVDADGQRQCATIDAKGTPCLAAAAAGVSRCCPNEPFNRCTVDEPFICVTEEGFIGCGENLDQPGVACPDMPGTCCANPRRCCMGECCTDGDGISREVEPLGDPKPGTTPLLPGETSEVSPTEEEEDDDDDEPTCFPANATVELENGTCKTMDRLQTGDRVRVSRNEFSAVFMWTHRDDKWDGKSYIQLVSAEKHRLVAAMGHMVYVCPGLQKECGKEAARVENVRIGDGMFVVEDGKERMVRVQERAQVYAKGLYNPQTVHGDIVVDGVLATCYTKYIPIGYAHGFLAPLRGSFGLFDTIFPVMERMLSQSLRARLI